jgi:hypothetical protein
VLLATKRGIGIEKPFDACSPGRQRPWDDPTAFDPETLADLQVPATHKDDAVIFDAGEGVRDGNLRRSPFMGDPSTAHRFLHPMYGGMEVEKPVVRRLLGAEACERLFETAGSPCGATIQVAHSSSTPVGRVGRSIDEKRTQLGHPTECRRALSRQSCLTSRSGDTARD